MNDTDLDLILAIADGELTGQAKQDALARIAADPELGEELAAQISAMDELRSLEPARMTASERSMLRSALVEQLNLQPVAAAIGMTKRRRPWWQPVLGLASAAALLIAIVAVPSMFTGSDDSRSDVVAVAPESAADEPSSSPDTAAAAEAVDDGTIAIPEISEDDVVAFFDSSTAGSLVDEADASIEGNDSVTDGAVSEGSDATVESVQDATVESVQDATVESVQDATVDIVTRLVEAPLTMIDTAELLSCLSTLDDTVRADDLVPTAATLGDDGLVVHLGFETADGIQYAVSVNLETCTITTIGG